MEYVALGRTGLKVSRLCLGCMSYGSPSGGTHPWALSEEEGRPFIRRALELGITFFDTSNNYSLGASESVLGRALRDFATRDEVVIATKVCSPMRDEPNGKGLSRKAIMQEIDASLRRLGTDYVDLYQIHRFDYDTPLEETLDALNDVVRAGKARYLGASSMHAWQFMKALGLQRAHGWAPFVSMQDFYNLLYREEEREMLPLCRSEGIGVIPWSPLGRGMLARPWSDTPVTNRAQTDGYAQMLFPDVAALDKPVVEAVQAVADGRGVPMAQVALAWVYQQAVVTAPIVGATKPHHLDDAVAAMSIALSPAEVATLEAPYRPHPVKGYR